jgi:hypothetical protein
MGDNALDALVYPTWGFPPRLIGDLNTPHGNNSPRLSPPTGFPAITVSMGFVRDSLPVGLQVLGRAWGEPTLIKIGFAYEQETRHRRPPARFDALFPQLVAGLLANLNRRTIKCANARRFHLTWCLLGPCRKLCSSRWLLPLQNNLLQVMVRLTGTLT